MFSSNKLHTFSLAKNGHKGVSNNNNNKHEDVSGAGDTHASPVKAPPSTENGESVDHAPHLHMEAPPSPSPVKAIPFFTTPRGEDNDAVPPLSHVDLRTPASTFSFTQPPAAPEPVRSQRTFSPSFTMGSNRAPSNSASPSAERRASTPAAIQGPPAEDASLIDFIRLKIGMDNDVAMKLKEAGVASLKQLVDDPEAVKKTKLAGIVQKRLKDKVVEVGQEYLDSWEKEHTMSPSVKRDSIRAGSIDSNIFAIRKEQTRQAREMGTTSPAPIIETVPESCIYVAPPKAPTINRGYCPPPYVNSRSPPLSGNNSPNPEGGERRSSITVTAEESSLWDFLRNKMGWGTDVMLKFREADIHSLKQLIDDTELVKKANLRAVVQRQIIEALEQMGQEYLDTWEADQALKRQSIRMECTMDSDDAYTTRRESTRRSTLATQAGIEAAVDVYMGRVLEAETRAKEIAAQAEAILSPLLVSKDGGVVTQGLVEVEELMIKLASEMIKLAEARSKAEKQSKGQANVNKEVSDMLEKATAASESVEGLRQELTKTMDKARAIVVKAGRR